MVYRYARRHVGERVLAVKGSSMPGRAIIAKPTAIEFNHHGKRIKNGGQLWLVGTDTAKGLLYGRMQVQDAGPGYVHTSSALPSYVWEQLTAERVVTRYIKGHARRDWVKPAGRRNEALDCAVYAMAAAWHIGVPRHTDAHWQRYEGRLRQVDLLALPLDSQGATIDAVAPSGGGDDVDETGVDAPQAEGQAPAAPVADAAPSIKAAPQPDNKPPARPPVRRLKRAGWVNKW
jgi:phage terminase large subunit GpA-like protein